MNAVIFIRANNARQEKKELAICTDFAKKSNMKVMDIIYYDGQPSGSPSDFEAFKRIVSTYLKHNGEISTLVVSRIDRISRSMRMLKLTMEMCKSLDISVEEALENTVFQS